MPAELERKLKAKARKKFGSTTSKPARKYIYGTMRKTGWEPQNNPYCSTEILTEGSHETVNVPNRTEVITSG